MLRAACHFVRMVCGCVPYLQMLRMACADGKVNSSEKQVLSDFRLAHSIPDEQHAKMLLELNWTVSEFERGRQARHRSPAIS